jgi:flagellar biosynthesis protein FliQ
VTAPLEATTASDRLGGRRELVAWLAILAIAAVLRLPDLAGRGTWDADQGHDMLVLRHLVVNGQVPLLGPPTSIGDFHHGVLYYFLLAPAALVSRADPVAVTTWIALGGITAVAMTGWLARSIAGPIAGIVAGLLLAVSATAVEESTFIWNPNVIALTSSIALAAAWRAHATGRARWWVVAGAAAVVTMHGHVLGVILTPVIAAPLVADWRARRTGRDGRPSTRRLAWDALAWAAIAVGSYVPLAIHELGTDGSEIRALVDFAAGGGGPSAVALPVRIVIVLVRVLGWPLGGLLTSAPAAVLLTTALVVGVVVWLGGLGRGTAEGGGTPADAATRVAVRWLGLGLAWAILALAVVAPTLATVVPGLPNDHYHAFADPMIVALVGIGVAAIARVDLARVGSGRLVAFATAAAIVVAIAGFNLANQPPATAADGGWRAAEAAAQRVITTTGGGPIVLTSLPTFKSDEALRMPLEAAGLDVAGRPADLREPTTRPVVILCHQLFHAAIGTDCGGPAETDDLGASGVGPAGADLIDRFEAAPGRWVSIYRPR